MPTLKDIAIGSNYTGDAGLGGGLGVGVTISPSPIDRFAQFQYYRDQNLWQQKQIEDRAAAEQIAKMTAFDITTPLKPFSEHLKKGVDELKEKILKNPNALTFGRDPKGYQEVMADWGKLQNARNSANTSDVVYNKRQADIDKLPEGKEKEVYKLRLQADIDDFFEKGVDHALNNTLNSSSPLKKESYKVPTVAQSNFTFIQQGANKDTFSKLIVLDLDKLKADSIMSASGIGKATIDETTQEFKDLPENRKQIARKEAEVIHEEILNNQRTADGINEAIQIKKQSDPEFKPSSVTEYDPSDTLMSIIASANIWNKQIRELNAMMDAGEVKESNTGLVVRKRYKEINIDDGISSDEVIQLKSLQENGNTLYKVEKDVDQHGNAIQLRGQSLSYSASMASKGSEAQPNAITDVAEYMFGHIKRTADYMQNNKVDVMNVPSEVSDVLIRNALGMSETGESYTQYKDGKIEVKDASGKIKSRTTLNDLKQKITQLRHGAGERGDVDAGTQKAVENAFGNNWDMNAYLQKVVSGKQEPVTSSNNNAYQGDTNSSNWKNNGNGTYTYIPTGQIIDSKTGKPK